MKILLIGTGTWGLALANLLVGNKHEVYAYSPIKDEIKYLNETRYNKNLDTKLSEDIKFVDDYKNIIGECEVVVYASPSVFIRKQVEDSKPYIKNQVVVNVAKGIEKDTLLTMSEVIGEVLNRDDVVTLSGPTHAEEVVKGLPTTIVSCCKKEENAKLVQDAFMNNFFRVYTNDDNLGVEICGALKNIIALACGISDGMGFGDNAKAALLTRGMFEMKKLGLKMGCKENTFYGLAGIGDMIVTGTSKHSRNNKCGYYLGQGLSVEEAIKKVNMTVEGINALPAAVELEKKYDVELPIVNAVNGIVNGEIKIKDVLDGLMLRDKKDENYIK